MVNAVILHGKPSEERYNWALEGLELMPHEANWLPWLAGQLTDRGVSTVVPALPNPYSPDYQAWKDTFEKESGDITSQTALIGHSAGAEFILRYLSEDPTISVEQAVLVAPYHDFRREDGTRKHGEFSEYDIDPALCERVGRLAIVYSTDDDTAILRNVLRLQKVLPDADAVQYEGFGHFRIGHNMQKSELPEVFEELSAPYRHKIAQLIEWSPEAIELELSRTASNWLACVGTRVFVIESYLPEHDITSTDRLYRARMEDLKIRLHRLLLQYPLPGSLIGDELKEDLLARLNVLADEYPDLLSDSD